MILPLNPPPISICVLPPLRPGSIPSRFSFSQALYYPALPPHRHRWGGPWTALPAPSACVIALVYVLPSASISWLCLPGPRCNSVLLCIAAHLSGALICPGPIQLLPALSSPVLCIPAQTRQTIRSHDVLILCPTGHVGILPTLSDRSLHIGPRSPTPLDLKIVDPVFAPPTPFLKLQEGCRMRGIYTLSVSCLCDLGQFPFLL